MKMSGDIFWSTLNISVASICRFLVRIITDLSCYIIFLKKMTICPHAIDANFIIQNTAIEHSVKGEVTKKILVSFPYINLYKVLL